MGTAMSVALGVSNDFWNEGFFEVNNVKAEIDIYLECRK